jgi:Protein of unknown function (DUF2971)
MKLYHLTTSQFALSALALRRLKVARLSELNDPFELQAVSAETPEHYEFFRRVKERIDSTHGVLCFSKNWSNPVLWGHYADKLRGVALGFEITSPHLVPVIYSKSPTMIDTDHETGLPKINDALIDRLQRTKFEDWQYEDEMRVYVQLDQSLKESGLYFYPFDESIVLTEIILGPRCELPVESLKALLGANASGVRVIKSQLATQSFNVVEAGER